MGSAPQQMILIGPGVIIPVGLVVDRTIDALLVAGDVLAIVAISYLIGVRGDRHGLFRSIVRLHVVVIILIVVITVVVPIVLGVFLVAVTFFRCFELILVIVGRDQDFFLFVVVIVIVVHDRIRVLVIHVFVSLCCCIHPDRFIEAHFACSPSPSFVRIGRALRTFPLHRF